MLPLQFPISYFLLHPKWLQCIPKSRSIILGDCIANIGSGTKESPTSWYLIYDDLEGFKASDSHPASIPVDLVVTITRSYIFIRHDTAIPLIELTVPHNSKKSLDESHKRKSQMVNYSFWKAWKHKV